MTSDRSRHPGSVYAAWRVIRVEGAVVVGVGALCLLLGWRSPGEIAQALLVAALLIVILGVLGSFTGRYDPHCVEYQFVRTMVESSSDRVQPHPPRLRLDVRQLLETALLGGLTLGIAWVVSLM